MTSKYYKWCAVPHCTNTTKKTPNKVFAHIPRNKRIRDKWFILARRIPKGVASRGGMYFCEDHFDLPNDMENYMQYHVMGSVPKVLMKPGCMPKYFTCQGRNTKPSNTTEPPDIPKTRKMIIEECEKQLKAKESSEGIASGSSVIPVYKISRDNNIEIKSEPIDYIEPNYEEITIKEEIINSEYEQITIKEEMIKTEYPEEVDTTSTGEDGSTDKCDDEKEKLEPAQEEWVLCNICQKTYKQDTWIEHQRTHSGERPFVCDICHKAYNRKAALLEHQRLHTGERPFVCDICDKTFARKVILQSHQQTHTGHKPFECNVCKKQFSQRRNFLMHRAYACQASEPSKESSSKTKTLMFTGLYVVISPPSFVPC